MLPLSITITLAALALTLYAIRGKRIDNAPLCRRCRFDLTGLESHLCPECGRNVSSRRSVRIGHRRRRPLAIAGSLVALLICLTFTTAASLDKASYDWSPWKPVWLLRAELRDPDAITTALAELDKRATDGSLSNRQLAAVARDATDVIAGAEDVRPLSLDFIATACSNLVARALASGALSPTDLESIVIAMFNVEFKFEDWHVPQGRWANVSMSTRELFVATFPDAAAKIDSLVFETNGQSLPVHRGRRYKGEVRADLYAGNGERRLRRIRRHIA